MSNDQSFPTTKAAARAGGLKYYFPNKKCPHGHVSPRRVSNETCRECERKRNREYNAKHREQVRATSKAWAIENADRNRETLARWYLRNRERLKPVRKKWDEANKEKRAAITARFLKTEKAKNNVRRWRQNNSEKTKAIKQKRRLRFAETIKHFTDADVKEIYKMQQGRCAYCRKNLHEKYHVDHIVAAASGGTNDRSNIQLCCALCNRKKSIKHPVTFAQEIGLLI